MKGEAKGWGLCVGVGVKRESDKKGVGEMLKIGSVEYGWCYFGRGWESNRVHH